MLRLAMPAPAGAAVPGPPQWMAERKCSPREITPSETRKPAASSTSFPGVRIVTASAVPPTRISSGSSTASVSERRALSAPTVSLTTGRRTVILPMASASDGVHAALRLQERRIVDGVPGQLAVDAGAQHPVDRHVHVRDCGEAVIRGGLCTEDRQQVVLGRREEAVA